LTEPDVAKYRAALLVLLHAYPPEQQGHAAFFLLSEAERLYLAGGITPPPWIRTLSDEFRGK
jgi:hypothetical protein